MPGSNLLVAVCLAYVAGLFAVAFWAERRAAQGRLGWLRAPMVYTLSLSVYCTAWTFYGAVGSAARGGLEFLPIYLGPTLVFVGWHLLPRKLLRVGHAQRITSIADLISSRYGKSPALGVIVTLIAVIGSTPYIALQLKSLTLSFAAFSTHDPAATPASPALTAFWVAAGLAVFTVLFGTRSVDANERHHGVVSAIAVEAVVKLGALLAVAGFVVWGVFSGPSAVFDAMPARLAPEEIVNPRWVTQTFLAACAIVCLPRMFHVLVVENVDERQLATAGWAFPLYLMLMSLPVLPIAIAGLATQPEGANPDLFMLSVPLAAGRDDVALLAFLGGFSAATSMVIVAAIALSTMISNHIVIPIWLRWRAGREGDLRRVILLARRISIAGLMALGYVYFLVSAPNALAAIGLISFAGAAQVAPALVGALYWRGATRAGAIAGISAGFAVWAYTLFLPSFEGGFLLSAAAIADGPFGFGLLRPRALFGLSGWDPLVHATFWSMAANVGAFVAVSLASTPRPLEQFQAAQFVDVFRQSSAGPGVVSRSATSEDLLALAARLLGPAEAQALFADEARAQGRAEGLPAPTDQFIDRVERELAGAVGAASAHELVAQTAGRGAVSTDGLMRMADETVQLIDAKRRLERQSRELEDAAAQLRDANDQLKRMDAAKDAFLSQVSHELRTPMTSIRSFAEILGDAEDLDQETTRHFLSIIRDESVRLTRLLDEILDLSFLESGRVTLKIGPVRIGDVVDRALGATVGLLASSGVPVAREGDGDNIVVQADFDRLAQVVINLVSNAVKYGRSDAPQVTIKVGEADGQVFVEVSDRGPGIPADKREAVFQKFQRLGEANLAGSAGLGLPIAREIMRNLGGDLVVLPNAPGAVFRASLPLNGGVSAG